MEYILVTEKNGNVAETSGNIMVQQKPGKFFYFYVMKTYFCDINYRLCKNVFIHYICTQILRVAINI